MTKVFVIGLGLLLFGVSFVGADVAGLEEALMYMDATLAEVESAAKHAKQGHAGEMSTHSNQAIRHAKEAIEVMPTKNPHGREAESLLKEAIANLTDAVKFVDRGKTKKATDRVYSALDFADAAISHLRHSH